MKLLTQDKKLNILILLTAISGIAALIILAATPLLFIDGKHEFMGNYGGFLSGVLGSLLSFVTVVLVYQTYNLQKHQLESQKEELSATRNQLKRQQFETVFFNMLSMINTIGNEIEFSDKANTYVESKLSKGHSFFRYFLSKLAKIKLNSNTPFSDELLFFLNNELALNYPDSGFELITDSSVPLKNPVHIDTSLKRFVTSNCKNEEVLYSLIYKFYFWEFDTQLGHFFRYVDATIRFVEKERGANGDVSFYLNLVQAQLTNHQLSVLFYGYIGYKYISSDIAWEGKELVDKYQFFKNLPQDLLIQPWHQKFYSQTEFNDKYSPILAK